MLIIFCISISCSTKDTLERHYADKHGCDLDGTVIRDRKLKCDHCSKQFRVKKELQVGWRG